MLLLLLLLLLLMVVVVIEEEIFQKLPSQLSILLSETLTACSLSLKNKLGNNHVDNFFPRVDGRGAVQKS